MKLIETRIKSNKYLNKQIYVILLTIINVIIILTYTASIKSKSKNESKRRDDNANLRDIFCPRARMTHGPLASPSVRTSLCPRAEKITHGPQIIEVTALIILNNLTDPCGHVPNDAVDVSYAGLLIYFEIWLPCRVLAAQQHASKRKQ